MFKPLAAKISTVIIRLLATLLFAVLITPGITSVAHADAPPGLPHQFYGNVTSGGALVSAGIPVVAKISGIQVASVTTDAQGRYGYSTQFLVIGTGGQTIEFFVNGSLVSQTATCSPGTITRLDLVSGDSTTTTSSCSITTTSLPAGTVGTAYSTTMAASGGTTPYTWSVASGLPAGLTINSTTGIISGTPTTAQTAGFTVQAIDSASHTCTRALSIVINSATAASTVVSVASSILGASDTFSLSNGVLAGARDLASSDGRLKLSLAANTAINMQGLTQLGAATESNPQASTDNSTLIRAYSFSPTGATFSPSATLTLKYETASLPAGATESNLYIAFWNGSAWERLSSSVNATLKEVSAPVAHFSTFSLRYLPPTSTTTTTTTTTTTSATISANILGTGSSFSTSGGTVSSTASLSSSNGNLSMSLAAGTVVSLPAGSQQVTVIQLSSPPAAPEGAKMVEAYAFGPENATFSPSITLTVKYDAASLASDVQESSLYLASLENSAWVPLASTVNTQAKTVTAQVGHFSIYGLLGKVTAAPATPAATSAFSTSDLTVSPASANPGEQVSISVRVVNGGTGEASKTVILKINDQAQEQKDVKLAAGKSQVLSFNVSKTEPGKYTVSVDAQSTTFTVKEAAAAPGGMSTAVLAVIIAGGLLIIVLVIILVMRQRAGGY